jgi:uncharacterized protein with PhoU and TrkA domain
MVLGVNRLADWQFNPSASFTLQSKDVLMVMATPQCRARLEQAIQGMG